MWREKRQTNATRSIYRYRYRYWHWYRYRYFPPSFGRTWNKRISKYQKRVTFNILTGLLLAENFTPDRQTDRVRKRDLMAKERVGYNGSDREGKYEKLPMHLHICKTQTSQRQLPTCSIQICVQNISHPQAAHSGFGFRIQDSGFRIRDWTGCRSHGVMSECVSSDAFTFIAFVNYSHKDIKCKLWNRRHTRAVPEHQSTPELWLRYNIRWMPHVYIGELLNSFCIWLSHAKPNRVPRFGLRSLNAQDPFAPSWG